ncbi:hypothetical protein CK203_115778 [Vitis vinifera]|uniref:Uncharacterized protein n=1 Tax=Vitis vinifera TaxID=29760 RepID=A0A438EZN4_VITVI|nr:hypothetical protein CK203_115778 [Vitis vinifera]
MSSKKKTVSSSEGGNACACAGRKKIPSSSQGTIQRGASVPSTGVVQGIPPFHQIPPAFIHPNIVRVLMGCSIINMLYNLDLTLLEIEKGGAKGHVGPGCMGGVEGSGRPFSPNYSLVIPDATERCYKTLLTARNLMVVVRESQESLKRRTLKNAERSWIIGEKKNEGTLHKAPGQKRGAASPPNKAPAKKRKLVKNGKGVKEPTPPKDFAPPPITHEAEVIIEEPVNPAPHSISSGSGHVAGLNHSSTSLAAVARLDNLAEEAASINHPDSPNPDVDAAEAGPPSKRPRSARNLRSGLIGRLQDRQQEMKLVAHPPRRSSGGGEVEMATETPAVPVMVPNEVAPRETHPAVNVEAPNPKQESPSVASSGGDLVNDAACTSASPFSYAELEDKLKQIPPGDCIVPSAKMFEMLVSGLRGMAQQHDLFTDLLRTTDYMKTFPLGAKIVKTSCLRLEEAEASLSTVREDNEALRADLAEAKSREESTSPVCVRQRMRWPG